MLTSVNASGRSLIFIFGVTQSGANQSITQTGTSFESEDWWGGECCLQWFEDWRMPRCFRRVEAGLGRAGLKVITNGARFALLFCSPGFKVS